MTGQTCQKRNVHIYTHAACLHRFVYSLLSENSRAEDSHNLKNELV